MKETMLERDQKNRPIKTQADNGAMVYYEHFQDVTHKAAFIRGRLAWVETVYKHHVNNEYVHTLKFWARQAITMKWSKPSSFSFYEGGLGVQFACQKDSNGQSDCEVTEDSLLDDDSYWLGNFAEMDRSSTQYQVAKQAAISTLMEWFEQLPDEPIPWRSKIR